MTKDGTTFLECMSERLLIVCAVWTYFSWVGDSGDPNMVGPVEERLEGAVSQTIYHHYTAPCIPLLHARAEIIPTRARPTESYCLCVSKIRINFYWSVVW